MSMVRSITLLLAVMGICLTTACDHLEPGSNLDSVLPAVDLESLKRFHKCQISEGKIHESIRTSVPFPVELPDTPSSGKAVWSRLGNSCLKAAISERVYDGPSLIEFNHYDISVEAEIVRNICIDKPADGECATRPQNIGHVLYYQRLTKEMVGDSFRGKKITDVVSYDQESGAVTFSINGASYVYDSRTHAAL